MTKRLLGGDNRGGALVPGTDAALRQLEDHCEQLNRLERRMGTNKTWFVRGEAPNREVSAR